MQSPRLRWLISYDYPGTVGRNGGEQVPIGRVYVTGPWLGAGVYSHTYDPDEATTFTEGEAAELLARFRWNNGSLVPKDQARHLCQNATLDT